MGKALASSLTVGLLIAAGYLSHRLGVLRTGDERVLNGFVYFFAFPAFLLLKLSGVEFDARTLRFLAAGAAPVGLLLTFLLGAKVVFRLRRDTFFFLSAGSVFGSLAFFGIPFIEVAMGEGEPVELAVAMIAAVAPLTVGLVLVLLELYGMEGIPVRRAVWDVSVRFSRNPLILSLLGGIALSVAGVQLPPFLRKALDLLGGAAAPVALFSLGVFLYGRRYRKLPFAFGMASLRLLLLPGLTLMLSLALGLDPLSREVAVLMNGTPVAVNMIVLSARYGFFPEEMAALILASSLGAIVTMNLWSFLV